MDNSGIIQRALVIYAGEWLHPDKLVSARGPWDLGRLVDRGRTDGMLVLLFGGAHHNVYLVEKSTMGLG